MKNIQSILSQEKIATLAIVVKFIVDSGINNFDIHLVRDLIGEGLRKIHDRAESFRGKGKHLGHPYWTKSALRQYELNISLRRNNPNIKKEHGLKHEHVIPIDYVINKILLSNKSNTPLIEYINQINSYSVVAIVTDDENKKLSNKMPQNWEINGMFARYIEAELLDEIEPYPSDFIMIAVS
jgi:hypothetical protein